MYTAVGTTSCVYCVGNMLLFVWAIMKQFSTIAVDVSDVYICDYWSRLCINIEFKLKECDMLLGQRQN